MPARYCRLLGTLPLAFLLLILAPLGALAQSDTPILTFWVYTVDDQEVETLRWKGDPIHGPDANSPEQTELPFVGFSKRFRVVWQASSKDAIAGYQYRASHLQTSPFLPQRLNPDTSEMESYWDLGSTSFDYANTTSPEDIPDPGTPEFESECPSLWEDCPEQLRFDSGRLRIQVKAIDESGFESAPEAGELWIECNYPPLTWLVEDEEWPKYYYWGSEYHFERGETVPDGAYVVFKKYALDRLEENQDQLPPGTPCCDERFDPVVPEVRYQTRIADARAVNDSGGDSFWSTLYSASEPPDTLGFFVGPFDYTVRFRSADEHDRVDLEGPEFTFRGGNDPSITSVYPPDGARLVLRAWDDTPGSPQTPWPENEVVHEIGPFVRVLYWDGTTYREDPCGDCLPMQGRDYRYRVEFNGEPAPEDPGAPIVSWAYALFADGDPNNFWRDGAGTDNIAVFDPSPTPNEWIMDEDGGSGDGPTIFVPNFIWTNPDLFDPNDPTQPFHGPGKRLADLIGNTNFELKGKTTKNGDVHTYYPFTVRPCDVEPECVSMDYSLTQLGRRTGLSETDFDVRLGLDPQGTGAITEYWPQRAGVPVLVSGFAAASVSEGVALRWDAFGAAGARSVSVLRMSDGARFQRANAEPIRLVDGPMEYTDRLEPDRVGSHLVYALELFDAGGNSEGIVAQAQLRFTPPSPVATSLHPNHPNPFNPTTTLRFDLATQGVVRLAVYDVSGKLVRVLVAERRPAGSYDETWDGRDAAGKRVASGVYLSRLEAGGMVQSQRMVMLK